VTNLCEAQKRGYVPVRITKDVNGWPVGSLQWFDPESNNNRVWNADCTIHWFHTLGDSCERTTTADPFSVGSVHTTRDGRKATIISTNLTDSPDEMLVLISSDDGDDYALLYKKCGTYYGIDTTLPYPYDLVPPQTTVTLTIPAHRVAELEEFANALR
jgi:hypothetical protein